MSGNAKQEPSQARLKEVLDYDPDTGVFTWNLVKDKLGRISPRYLGKVAGCITERGYVSIGVGGQNYFAHRLAWIYVHGQSAGHDDIDHINRDRSDNRIANLRVADRAHNLHRKLSTAASGIKGVYWFKPAQRWKAAISVDNKYVHLGYFYSKDAAGSAYREAAAKLHGEFAEYE